MTDYSASGIEFNANCEGDVYITFNTSYISDECYYTVIVDGVEKERDFCFLTTTGVNKVKIAENLPNGNHSFKIYRQNEIEFARVGITWISLNGDLLAPPENKDLFIEYVGASTMCGYGNLATSSTPSADVHSTEYEDITKAFTYLSAQHLNADWSIVARQGTGVAYGWQPTSLIDIYPYIRHMYDSTTEYDFARQPDYIVIGASGNDISAYDNRASISHISDNLTKSDIEQGYIDFLTLLREKNPNAKIIYLANYMSGGAIPHLYNAVNAKGGNNAGFYVLKCTRNNDGGKSHPSAAGHAVVAEEIATFINSLEQK